MHGRLSFTMLMIRAVTKPKEKDARLKSPMNIKALCCDNKLLVILLRQQCRQWRQTTNEFSELAKTLCSGAIVAKSLSVQRSAQYSNRVGDSRKAFIGRGVFKSGKDERKYFGLGCVIVELLK